MQSPTNHEEKVEGNPIGSLQEMCAAWGWPLPTYNPVSEIGSPHLKEFTIECIMLQRREIGKGKTKKIAKHTAAHKMWTGIQQRPINRTEISKILNEEKNQMGKMSGMTKKVLVPTTNFPSQKNRKNFLPAQHTQGPKKYLPKDLSTTFSKNKRGPSGKLTAGTFSKFRNHSNIPVKREPIPVGYVKNKSGANPLDNNFISNFQKLRVTLGSPSPTFSNLKEDARRDQQLVSHKMSSRLQEYPIKINSKLDNLDEKKNEKKIGEMKKKTTSKSRNCSSHNSENLKRISLQEVSLYSERNVPFTAMGAEFSKRKVTPCTDLIAKPIPKENSLSEIPMENKPNNYKKIVTSNPIGHLQERCLARGWPVPEYGVVSEFGLPHERKFIVECKILHYREIGKGNNKKLAKKLAAHRMWSKLEEYSLEINK